MDLPEKLYVKRGISLTEEQRLLYDDIRTQAKKADWGGVLGGVVGGVLGTFIGAPWLGVGLGNMAGEFLGGALDMPEVTANIEKIKLELANEQTAINAEIAGLQADIIKNTQQIDKLYKTNAPPCATV